MGSWTQNQVLQPTHRHSIAPRPQVLILAEALPFYVRLTKLSLSKCRLSVRVLTALAKGLWARFRWSGGHLSRERGVRDPACARLRSMDRS